MAAEAALAFNEGGRVICAFSFFTADAPSAQKTALDLRKRFGDKIFLMAGGPHATALAQETLELGFDAAGIGEGEISFPSFLRKFIAGENWRECAGFAFIKDGRFHFTGRAPVTNLDEFFPIAPKSGRYSAIEISRGCPNACAFCQVTRLAGSVPRYRSVEKICEAADIMAQVGMLKDLLSKISEYKEYAVEIETGLTAIPALDPTSGGEGEYDKAVWLEGELKKLKFDELYRIDAPQATAKNGVRPNIIAKYYGENKNKTLWIMTHLDVVPPGERSLWKTDPYKVHREGDKIYGRGVEDNQQGLVSSLLCVKAFMPFMHEPDNEACRNFSVFSNQTITVLRRAYAGRRQYFRLSLR